jgi:Ca2+/Na+ antiporter
MLTESLILAAIVLVVGLVLLVVGSDQLVDGLCASEPQARGLPVVVGVVIIGFGTSTPELLVSRCSPRSRASSTWVWATSSARTSRTCCWSSGSPPIVGPVLVGRSTVRREVPLSLLGVAAFAWAIQGELRRVDALLLAVLLVAVIVLLLWLSPHDGATGDRRLRSLHPSVRGRRGCGSLGREGSAPCSASRGRSPARRPSSSAAARSRSRPACRKR